ncbi:MAG: FMN-binding protein [Flavobacteriales bacterium]|nr:FMN-binding protein [Flavobacteriales bacterium]
MNFKNHISKAITVIVIALLFSSFKASYWELDKDSRATVYKSIAKIFNSQTCNLDPIDDTFYSISEDDSIIGYLAVTDAPSKFHRFDYYVLFNDKEEILKVEVLHYRENYGGEICSKNWLKQFVGIDTENYSNFNREIDGISGATISVNSLKHHLLKISNKLKKSRK